MALLSMQPLNFFEGSEQSPSLRCIASVLFEFGNDLLLKGDTLLIASSEQLAFPKLARENVIQAGYWLGATSFAAIS